MTKIELGRLGAVVAPNEGEDFVGQAVDLEGVGVSTIWITGGPLAGLHRIAEVVRATERVLVASGIIAVIRFGAQEVVDLYHDLESTHPGRFVVGLGGAHGPKPFATLSAYLDELDAADPPVPAERRVLAALGPKMLALAAARSSGAFPVLVHPAYTSEARARLGDTTTLAIEQLAVAETDPDRARAAARVRVGFLGQLPAYQANFRRLGFDDEAIATQSDALVDALVPWGDAKAIAARGVEAHFTAGADHVALSLLGDKPWAELLEDWRAVAALTGATGPG
jgi:probable F420-dependent oxidoreductase